MAGKASQKPSQVSSNAQKTLAPPLAGSLRLSALSTQPQLVLRVSGASAGILAHAAQGAPTVLARTRSRSLAPSLSCPQVLEAAMPLSALSEFQLPAPALRVLHKGHEAATPQHLSATQFSASSHTAALPLTPLMLSELRSTVQRQLPYALPSSGGLPGRLLSAVPCGVLS